MAVLEYKGYLATVDFSVDDKVFYGTLTGINDFVDFSSENASQIETEFHKAVNDYLDFCKEVGKSPDKTYKGVFNVRLSPSLHKQASLFATRHGITLNEFMTSAVTHELARAHDTLPPTK